MLRDRVCMTFITRFVTLTTAHLIKMLDIVDLLREREAVKVGCQGVSVVGVEVSKELVH